MKKRAETPLPRARQSQLVIQGLPDELLVYDLERHRAYCLNQTAALIWQSCDGRRTVEEMVRVLERETGYSVSESLIWYALEQFERSHLLDEEQAALPVLRERMTRRELARRLGFATAVLIPFITSITAPTAAQTATCGALGSPCTTNGRCCSKLCINGTCMCLANQTDCSQAFPEQCCSGRCGSANNKCLP
jgi:Coenzyme PQQ synthesis protein D (PqqD)